jgi:hypothetical protein
MRRTLIITFAVVVLLGGNRAGHPSQTEPSESVKKLMSLKLDYMKNVMQSIIEQDYASIEHYSFRMAVLIGANDWKVIRTEEYNRHTDEFENAVEKLLDSSKHRDIDESASAYINTMLKCVQCHKYVRQFQLESEK